MFAPSAKTSLNDASKVEDTALLPAKHNPSSLTAVADSKVKDASQMVTFISYVQPAIESEVGTLTAADKGKFPIFSNQMNIAQKASKADMIKAVAAMFGTLKSLATSSGAAQTAKAITTAAAWFWNNIEKPSQSGTSVAAASAPVASSYRPPPAASVPSESLSTGRTVAPSTDEDEDEDEISADDPFYRKTWFWVAAGIGTVAVVGAIWYFWPSDAELAAAEGGKA
jgi:hypothetical protein